MNRYVITPNKVRLQDIVNHDWSLSSSQYIQLVLPNPNYRLVSDFLSRKLNRSDLGIEVGSLSYIDKSPVFFMRTKALQPYSFIPDFTKESMLPILPQDFVNMHLKRGDVLISKDSNIGEIVILDKDYKDCMLSGAIYKLPIKEDWKYYLLAFIKHPILIKYALYKLIHSTEKMNWEEIYFKNLKTYIPKYLFPPMVLYLTANASMNCFALALFMSNPTFLTSLIYIGGLLFFISDCNLFAVRFKVEDAKQNHFIVMSTYIIAELLIVIGIINI